MDSNSFNEVMESRYLQLKGEKLCLESEKEEEESKKDEVKAKLQKKIT